jgi:hypothetical protein
MVTLTQTPLSTETIPLSSKTVPTTPRAKVEVQSWPADAPHEKVAESLRKAGGIIIKNFTSIKDVHQMEKELRPFLDRDLAWKGSFFPKETRRCHNLVTNSPTFADKGTMNSLYQAMTNEFMTTSNWFWKGHRKIKATSNPQLMNTVCFSINPGARAQELHRDDGRITKLTQQLRTSKTEKHPWDCSSPASQQRSKTARHASFPALTYGRMGRNPSKSWPFPQKWKLEMLSSCLGRATTGAAKTARTMKNDFSSPASRHVVGCARRRTTI